MRTLVVTVTTGHGHNASARTMEESLKAKGSDVVVLDMYQYISKVLYKVVDKGYLLSIQRAPRGFGRAYTQLERREIPRRAASALTANRVLAGRLASFFQDYQPDVIITTHVLAAQVLDVLKKQGMISAPIIGIITDYCILPLWETVPRVEYIVTASDLMRYAAERRGIEPERLIPFGIPVASRFAEARDQKTARRELGLDEDKTTILLMGGSMGYGDLVQSVQEIDQMDKGYQLVCIAGGNERLFTQLKDLKTKHPLHVCGFTKQVDGYMDAADCLITKPGGLSVSEALAKNLPMILVSPIPGQEERNAHFLVNAGAAVMVSKHFHITEAVYGVLESERRLQHMRDAISAIARPNAAADIADFAFRLGGKQSDTQVKHAYTTDIR